MTDTLTTTPIFPTPPAAPSLRRPHRRGLMIAAGCLVLTAGIAVGGLAVSSMQQASSRQQIVGDRGTDVMPFDQTATTHSFTDTTDGGYETVRANDPGDIAQIELVRGHLRQIASAFAAGDFSDPAAIHGADMSGLAALSAGAGELSIIYADVSAGGRITFSSTDPALVGAVHEWFAAQTSDHHMSDGA